MKDFDALLAERAAARPMALYNVFDSRPIEQRVNECYCVFFDRYKVEPSECHLPPGLEAPAVIGPMRIVRAKMLPHDIAIGPAPDGQHPAQSF